VLYAFMSASNNNGSAFAGISVNTGFYNTALGLCMLAGRFIPIVLVLRAGRVARPSTARSRRPPARFRPSAHCSSGCCRRRRHRCGLTFFPRTALGPLAEGL
jgi:K+-transporting ATPase ATPase A chain